jgi:hypothetical protein
MFADIKVGSAVIDQIDELALSLSFPYRVDPCSLIHGARLRLNEILELVEVNLDYIEVTCFTGKYLSLFERTCLTCVQTQRRSRVRAASDSKNHGPRWRCSTCVPG